MLVLRIFKLSLLCIFINCHSSQTESFRQLESALISWYYKYHPTIASEHCIPEYNNQIEKYDSSSLEEYKADINRFIIELSQIDETKLENDDLVRYLVIDEFLFQKHNDVLDFKELSYNPTKFLKNLYNSLFFILYNNQLNMDEKTDFVLSRLILFPITINSIKANITYYSKYDIEESLQFISIFKKLLNNLPLYINSDEETLDEIDRNISISQNHLDDFKTYLKNINKKNVIDKQNMMSNYLNYNSNTIFNLDYKVLIQQIHHDMLDIALPRYKVNNDEPVWLDIEDTLNTINIVINEFASVYPSENEIIVSIDESLKRIVQFSNENNLNSKYNINDNYEFIIKDHIYLSPHSLYDLWSDRTTTYLFLNRKHYAENDLVNNLNKYALDLYNMKNYFPGKYFQIAETQKGQRTIQDIFVNNYTNSGWGLLSEYFFINRGYGNDENDIYMLTHLNNVLNSIIKNMIFSSYYIKKKTKIEIIDEVHDLTFYEKTAIEKILLNVLNNPIESNFELFGYLKLKDLYNQLGEEKLLDFYSVLIRNAHLSPALIKEFKF